MDFTAKHLSRASVASESGVCIIDIPTDEIIDSENGDSEDIARGPQLDRLMLMASNTSAREATLCGRPDSSDKLVDTSNYPEIYREPHSKIQEGDLVVIFESFENLKFAYVRCGDQYANRFGQFPHEDFIGKPFGTKLRSRNNQGYGFCYLLRPTPELWSRSLYQRTQIVHELDQSQIVFQLWLKPNMTVVESGTGSGAMSHALLRTIAPKGHLYTYEFNKVRADAARSEFEKNGVQSLVTVSHRDVQKDGFDRPAVSVDAIFLDLPEPWWAVSHAASILRPGGRLASYSPCMEQTQRVVQALNNSGFHSIKTMEYRLREHYVDEINLPPPPGNKRPRFVTHDQESRRREAAAMGEETVTVDEDKAMPNSNEESVNVEGTEGNPMVVARPYTMMRGHTAFLTFATAACTISENNI